MTICISGCWIWMEFVQKNIGVLDGRLPADSCRHAYPPTADRCGLMADSETSFCSSPVRNGSFREHKYFRSRKKTSAANNDCQS